MSFYTDAHLRTALSDARADGYLSLERLETGEKIERLLEAVSEFELAVGARQAGICLLVMGVELAYPGTYSGAPR